MTRAKELSALLTTLKMTNAQAAKYLTRPNSPVSAQDIEDYSKWRREVPGWALEWLIHKYLFLSVR